MLLVLQPQVATPAPDRLLPPVEQVLLLLAEQEVLVSEAVPGQVQQLLPEMQPELKALQKCVSLRLRSRS